MEGYCSTGQSPQWAVVPVEEEEEVNEVWFWHVIGKFFDVIEFGLQSKRIAFSLYEDLILSLRVT
jgi:hypothetical protein